MFEASDSWRSDSCIGSAQAKGEALSFSPPLPREKWSLVLALGVPGQPALGFIARLIHSSAFSSHRWQVLSRERPWKGTVRSSRSENADLVSLHVVWPWASYSAWLSLDLFIRTLWIITVDKAFVGPCRPFTILRSMITKGWNMRKWICGMPGNENFPNSWECSISKDVKTKQQKMKTQNNPKCIGGEALGEFPQSCREELCLSNSLSTVWPGPYPVRSAPVRKEWKYTYPPNGSHRFIFLMIFKVLVFYYRINRHLYAAVGVYIIIIF